MNNAKWNSMPFKSQNLWNKIAVVFWKKSYQLSERLVSLGIIEAKLNLSILYCCNVWRVSESPWIGRPCWCQETQISQTVVCLIVASEAKWALASERSKLYLTNMYLEKTCISETKHFGHMVLGTKSVCFDPISRYMEWTDPTRPGPTRPDPTVTLLRGL